MFVNKLYQIRNWMANWNCANTFSNLTNLKCFYCGSLLNLLLGLALPARKVSFSATKAPKKANVGDNAINYTTCQSCNRHIPSSLGLPTKQGTKQPSWSYSCFFPCKPTLATTEGSHQHTSSPSHQSSADKVNLFGQQEMNNCSFKKLPELENKCPHTLQGEAY